MDKKDARGKCTELIDFQTFESTLIYLFGQLVLQGLQLLQFTVNLLLQFTPAPP